MEHLASPWVDMSELAEARRRELLEMEAREKKEREKMEREMLDQQRELLMKKMN